MPNLNVCTGRAFGTGSLGELEPANVRSLTWPFSSSPTGAAAQMAAANGLRYDQSTASPGGGLWVPQVGPNAAMIRQSGAPGSVLATNSTQDASLTNVSFTNPSTIQTLAVMVQLTFTLWLQLGGANWAELWASASLSVGSAAIPYEAYDADNAPGAYQWHAAYSDSMAFTVAPSSTVNLIPRLTAKNVSGSGSPALTFAGWHFVCSSFTALIDPSSEG